MSRRTPIDLRVAALEAFVRRVAELEVRAWYRDGESVVTMSKADARKLVNLAARARDLATTRPVTPPDSRDEYLDEYAERQQDAEASR